MSEPTPALILPSVPENTLPIDHQAYYELRVWKDGQCLERHVRLGYQAVGFATGLFKFRNIGTREEAAWTKLGNEIKLSFARPWTEGDTVVYLEPLEPS